jgi:ADP-ribosyl-[dinitrogen reductase] hydrolase
MNQQSRLRGALIGLAVGDAVGTTVEFRTRGSFPPVSDMLGGGPFQLRAGEWTDDTSMALCLAASLVETGGFDAHDQMVRYCRWRDEGYMSSNGRCFDIGGTVSAALARFQRSGDPFSGSTEPHSAGNGSIMRLAPVVLFYYPDVAAVIDHAAQSSRTTHAAPEAVDACRLLAAVIFKALAGQSKQEILFGDLAIGALAGGVQAIADGAYRSKSVEQIKGSGYVVESLEAALWCFHTTDSFRDAILAAANLGQDADTTAAVCGQIAGAFYGEEGIPAEWRERLAQRELIGSLADQLARGQSIGA